MSPEQVRGEDVDERSDVFSAGVMLYELLSGENPFQRSDVDATVRAVLGSEPAPIDGGNEAVGNVLRRALEKCPSARFPNAAAFAAALRGAIGVATRPSWPDVPLDTMMPPIALRIPRGAHPAMRASVGAMVLAAIGITLLILTAGVFHTARGATAGRMRARPAAARQCETEAPAALARSHVDSPRSTAPVPGSRLPAIVRDPGF
jgi:serine/threonine-protein kinase